MFISKASLVFLVCLVCQQDITGATGTNYPPGVPPKRENGDLFPLHTGTFRKQGQRLSDFLIWKGPVCKRVLNKMEVFNFTSQVSSGSKIRSNSSKYVVAIIFIIMVPRLTSKDKKTAKKQESKILRAPTFNQQASRTILLCRYDLALIA